MGRTTTAGGRSSGARSSGARWSVGRWSGARWSVGRRAGAAALGAAALVVTACGGTDPAPAASGSAASTAASTAGSTVDPEVVAEPGAVPPEATADGTGPSGAASPAAAPLDLADVEAEAAVRVGVHAVDTGTGRAVAWRQDERFAYASTIKALAAAVVLQRTDEAGLDEVVTYSADDLVPYSPVTEDRIEQGLPLRDAAAAAVEVSDNTAGNLLFEQVGGPAGLDAALQQVGDDVTEVVRDEPELNEAARGDTRDTSTPQALARTLRAYAVDDALDATDREQLLAWLRGSTTGDALARSVVADGWTVGSKTGTGGYGTRNEVTVLTPPEAPRRWSWP
ncbi:class A beta-lactamase [Jannaschia sp. R86511]|uniref:class A beta-lactamase n=1 Tax=Jannaschia sp. R86511 TaxID=3093853 RepID=UPI0036D31E50